MLTENKEANCSRCEKKIECKPNDIRSCDCSKIELSKEEYHFINARFKNCVCNACLMELKAEYQKEARYTKPHVFKDRTFGMFLFSFFFTLLCTAQTYAPPVGQPGTTAIHKDSSVFVNWVKSCSVTRAYQDLSNTSLGLASAGDSSKVTGNADITGVVSLGDGGSAICQFEKPIRNDTGFDFAVFENGFDNVFLELAFVEVSSDGINFYRFPSHSLSDTLTQTAGFGSTDATKINNLAGKYRGGYGTPFDLQDLMGTEGLDLNKITHVKIIDVVGSVNKSYATRDSQNNIINDPWPTPFPSSGFDLDAIGVIHESSITDLAELKSENDFLLYPNPLSRGDMLRMRSASKNTKFEIFSLSGICVFSGEGNALNTSFLSAGIYLLKVQIDQTTKIQKLLVH